MTGLIPAAEIAGLRPYDVPRHPAPCDLDLSGTSVRWRNRALRWNATAATAGSARYPDTSGLTRLLAARHRIEPSRLLLTAGADEALERACRVILTAGRTALCTDPAFEMLPRFVQSTGAACLQVPWNRGDLPVEAMLAVADASTSLIAVATPNNPTGLVASLSALRALHEAVPTALLLVDLAYVEFAESDPTPALLDLERVVVTRTLSKAWGLPGLRLGYAAGGVEPIGWLRALGCPFPVSAASVALGAQRLRGDATPACAVVPVQQRREHLHRLLTELGVSHQPSQGSFACIEGRDAAWLHDALAGQGIATRGFFGGNPPRLRLGIPGNGRDELRLRHALRTAMMPEALLFDLDGVLVDVSGSYRECIRLTAASFGVEVTMDDVAAIKAAAEANDDWEVTATLLRGAGREVPREVIIATFQRLYNGDGSGPGLAARERALLPPSLLTSLGTRIPLGVVTGRPRAEAEAVLARFGVREAFRVLVSREDAPLKPCPEPVRLALRTMRVRRAWMIGDTPDDIRAARGAATLPIGVLPPGSFDPRLEAALYGAGAARVARTLEELTAWLP